MPTFIDYPSGFAIGDCVKIRNHFYKITGKDSLRINYVFTSAIASGATSSDTSMEDLNPKYCTELYQIVQVVPQHNVQVYLKQPASTLRWGTNKAPSVGFVSDRLSTYDGGEINNIFITNYQQPVIQVKNNTLVSMLPRIFFLGWKYMIEELPRAPPTYTEVQYGGFD